MLWVKKKRKKIIYIYITIKIKREDRIIVHPKKEEKKKEKKKTHSQLLDLGCNSETIVMLKYPIKQ